VPGESAPPKGYLAPVEGQMTDFANGRSRRNVKRFVKEAESRLAGKDLSPADKALYRQQIADLTWKMGMMPTKQERKRELSGKTRVRKGPKGHKAKAKAAARTRRMIIKDAASF